MNSEIRVPLLIDAEQAGRLLTLQATFSRVCNVLAPVAARQRCWNRVTLHHLMYQSLRDQFPALGSKMVCNVIYMVCKMGRLVYQSPDGPFNIARMGDKPLPVIHFAANGPVYFDSHTLSMKSGQLSIFTLGGRMRFALDLRPAQMVVFASRRVLQVTLRQRPDGAHELSFFFASPAASALPVATEPAKATHIAPLASSARTADTVTTAPTPVRGPDYLQVEEVR